MKSVHKGNADRELEAIGAILRALEGLDGDSIQRVFDYVLGRLSIVHPSHSTVAAPISVASTPLVSSDVSHAIRKQSIRDLKDEKKPESSNQMAALVAYYLSEVVGQAEAKYTINATDLEKYFKQAGFKLPKSLVKTLHNAAAAGYFDAKGNGQYSLNPVGYNLVVHGLPRAPGNSTPSKQREGGKNRK